MEQGSTTVSMPGCPQKPEHPAVRRPDPVEEDTG